MAKCDQLRLVLLGECGSGKSCSGNTILGENQFRSKASSKSNTIKCQVESKVIYGTEVQIMDTPHFFDDELKNHISDCRELCEGGMCVYLLVIQIGRSTRGESVILVKLETALDTKVRDRAIILFTRGDDLKQQSIEDYIRHTNEHLQKLIKECGDRYQVFNNNNKREAAQQVRELMGKVATLLQKTDKVEVFPQYDTEKSKKEKSYNYNCIAF